MAHQFQIKWKESHNKKSFFHNIRTPVRQRFVSKSLKLKPMYLKRNLLLFGSVLFFAFHSSAQYKWDIGLKTSSFDKERFQLEARYHLESPYTLTAAFISGSRGSGSYQTSHVYNDSLVDVTYNNHISNNYGLKFGVQRKLGFLASDVFYAGATIGFGYEQQRSSLHTSTYSVGDSTGTYPYPYYYQTWNELSSVSNVHLMEAINAQLGLSFGMDVPLTKRFSINAEIGFAGYYSRSLTYQLSIITLQPTVSGGVRYRFGKRAE